MGIVSAIVATFTAIKAGLVAIGITGTAATIIAGVVTAGIAVGTARQLGAYLKPDLGPLDDPGTRIQLPPATDNKVPIVYGTAWTSGPIIDVNISNSNETMHYCIVLSEETDSGSFSIGDIYWNDAKLVFSNHTVVSRIDKNSTSNTDWNGKIRMRAYAGGTDSTKQVFPPLNRVDATTMMPHWTNTTQYTMSGLVFLMVEVDYDAENGLQGLGALTIQVKNSLNNPGDVLLDYMTNSRYGCGIKTADIDTDSITGSGATSMKSISNELVPFTNTNGVASTRKRYTIDGVLSTFETVKNNIDKICIASSAFFMFDGKQGKFKIKMNHEEDTSSAFELNDDNIISGIKVQNTNLFDQFNEIQVEFADVNRRDQSNTIFLETPASDRMANEPDNTLEYRIDMINNNIQAKGLANIDLSQTRNNQILQLAGDHSTLQIDVGDVVKVTNDTYGLSNAEYRVMRIKEKEDESSVLSTELTMIQYNDNIYGNVSVTETDYNDAANANIIITDTPPVIINPPSVYRHYFPGVTQKSTTGSGSGAKFDVLKDFLNVTYFIPAVSGGNPTANGGTNYAAGDNVTISGNVLGGVDGIHDCTFTVSNAPAGVFNQANAVSGICFVIGGAGNRRGIPGEVMGDLAVGTQVSETPADKTDLNATGTFKDLAAAIDIDLTEVDSGEYTINNNFTPIGSHQGITTADYGVGIQGDVTFANGDTQNDFIDSRTRFDDRVDQPDVLNSQTTFTVTDQMESVSLRLVGFNTSNQTAGTSERGFENMKLDFIRLRGGDIF